jgi:hypothetical protein
MTRYTYGDCYERWLVTDHYWCSSGGSCIYLYTTYDTYLGTYCY